MRNARSWREGGRGVSARLRQIWSANDAGAAVNGDVMLPPSRQH